MLMSSFLTRYMYIVKGSVTTDEDIMLREVQNYKLQIPPFIQVALQLWIDCREIPKIRRIVQSFFYLWCLENLSIQLLVQMKRAY